jgi:hypothetical protein
MMKKEKKSLVSNKYKKYERIERKRFENKNKEIFV